jgi:hypothetical protein
MNRHLNNEGQECKTHRVKGRGRENKNEVGKEGEYG